MAWELGFESRLSSCEGLGFRVSGFGRCCCLSHLGCYIRLGPRTTSWPWILKLRQTLLGCRCRGFVSFRDDSKKKLSAWDGDMYRVSIVISYKLEEH